MTTRVINSGARHFKTVISDVTASTYTAKGHMQNFSKTANSWGVLLKIRKKIVIFKIITIGICILLQ